MAKTAAQFVMPDRAGPPATSPSSCRAPTRTPESEEAAATLELAIPLLDEAAGGHVEGMVGDSDPFAAVEQALERGGFDEIIISTLPARVSRWLRHDLPHRVEGARLARHGGHRQAVRAHPL